MRLRFTIRDLLWLTALIAMAVGWWLDRKRSDMAMRDTQMEVVDLKERLSKMQVFLNGQPAIYHSVPFKVQAAPGSSAPQ
jgi:hypothetical protein